MSLIKSKEVYLMAVEPHKCVFYRSHSTFKQVDVWHYWFRAPITLAAKNNSGSRVAIADSDHRVSLLNLQLKSGKVVMKHKKHSMVRCL